MNYIISTENTCDLSAQTLSNYNVSVLNLTYSVDGEEYGGNTNKELPISEFYAQMREGALTKTSMANRERAKEYFEKLLENGKDILHISFASACSGTYDNVVAVANELNEKNANKIYVVDSLAESLGQGLLVEMVVRFSKEHTILQTLDYANDVKNRIYMLFTVSDLKYLARGGRISKTSATFGNVLNIKPILSVDEGGKLIARTKVFSRKISLSRMIEKTKEKFNREYCKIYIGHADCKEDAEVVAKKLIYALDVPVQIENIGPVIGAHSGPGTLAIFFTANDRSF